MKMFQNKVSIIISPGRFHTTSRKEFGNSRRAKSKHVSISSSNALHSRVALAEKVTSSMIQQAEAMRNKSIVSEISNINDPVGSQHQPDKLTKSQKVEQDPNTIVFHLPEVGIDEQSGQFDSTNEVHIYASPGIKHYRGKENRLVEQGKKSSSKPKSKSEKYQRTLLQPDPILSLKKVLGFGGATYKHVLWLDDDDEYVVYPCQAVIVLLEVATGKQRFLLGHTDKISALAVTKNSTMLASAQCGEDSVIRIWNCKTRKCSNVFQTQITGISLLSFSLNGEKLCAVGEDTKGKQVVTVWNTSFASRGGKVTLIAKAHTELNSTNICCMKFVLFDDTRLISCGNHNIRIWRVKSNSLRSCPVDLHQFSSVCFTGFCVEETHQLKEDITNISLYFTTDTGSIYEVNYKSFKLVNMYNLNSSGSKHENPQKKDFNMSLNTVCFSPHFFAVGSNDGFLRLWSLDFVSVILEAEHDGPISVVSISGDGTKVLAGTSTGNLGILNISKKSYSTITRSHTSSILSFSFEPIYNHIATICSDGSIKLWNENGLSQAYDFQAADEHPISICCHPCKAEFACGFRNGIVRLFSLATTSLLFELKEHHNEVHSVIFSQTGENLYSASKDGTLVMYDTLQRPYEVLRCLPNSIARKNSLPCNAMTLDGNGQRLAAIGPSEFLVTVFAARSLDQLLLIDVTLMPNHGKFVVDEAIGVLFTPPQIGHLVVVTSTSRILKFECTTGQLLSEFSSLHERIVSSFCCSRDGKYLATAGDNSIKVCDYHLEKDNSYQIFVGHCSSISKLQFSLDDEYLISCGDTLFLWDFLAFKNYGTNRNKKEKIDYDTAHINIQPEKLLDSLKPRQKPPQPVTAPNDLDFSVINIQDDSGDDDEDGNNDELRQKADRPLSVSDNEIDFVVQRNEKDLSIQEISDDEGKTLLQKPKPLHISASVTQHAAPNVFAHFKARLNTSELPKKCYAAPLNQAGMKLSAFIGCNGNSRNNVAWHPETGLFLYTSGCTLILEDLNSGKQCLLHKHSQEIATLALQNDAQAVATGGSLNSSTNYGEICIWNIKNGACHKVLEVHQCSVIALQYSRDDRYLVSIGDYHECSIVIWCTREYVPLTEASSKFPMHAVEWHPYSANELVTVGRNQSVLFWYISDEKSNKMLQVTNGEVPQEVFRHPDECHDITAVCYADRDLMFTATSQGVVCAWNVQNKRCFMHWQADDMEIVVLIARFGKLLTGSSANTLCLWSVAGIERMNENESLRDFDKNGLVLTCKKKLDSAIISGSFDDLMDMGVVGTLNGTIYYVNWDDTSDVRIVSGHHKKILNVTFCDGSEKYFATTSLDGSLRLWSLETREQSAQFLVIGQGCTCVAFRSLSNDHSINSNEGMFNQLLYPVKPHVEHPSQCVAGYEDGTVRMFDFGRMDMLLKMKPHSSSVAAIMCSHDGRVVISGSHSGLLAVSSMSTGMTIRVINDHRGAGICNIRRRKCLSVSSLSMWLASSSDRRISVWQADWSKDLCELVDWITFPGSNYSSSHITPEEKVSQPTLADFDSLNTDIIIYTGYGFSKEFCFYSLSKKKVIKTINITDWALSMDVSPSGNLLAVGCADRLVKLIDSEADTFQDFLGHTHSVQNVKFSSDGKHLLASANTELSVWEILV